MLPSVLLRSSDMKWETFSTEGCRQNNCRIRLYSEIIISLDPPFNTTWSTSFAHSAVLFSQRASWRLVVHVVKKKQNVMHHKSVLHMWRCRCVRMKLKLEIEQTDDVSLMCREKTLRRWVEDRAMATTTVTRPDHWEERSWASKC